MRKSLLVLPLLLLTTTSYAATLVPSGINHYACREPNTGTMCDFYHEIATDHMSGVCGGAALTAVEFQKCKSPFHTGATVSHGVALKHSGGLVETVVWTFQAHDVDYRNQATFSAKVKEQKLGEMEEVRSMNIDCVRAK